MLIGFLFIVLYLEPLGSVNQKEKKKVFLLAFWWVSGFAQEVDSQVIQWKILT